MKKKSSSQPFLGLFLLFASMVVFLIGCRSGVTNEEYQSALDRARAAESQLKTSQTDTMIAKQQVTDLTAQVSVLQNQSKGLQNENQRLNSEIMKLIQALNQPITTPTITVPTPTPPPTTGIPVTAPSILLPIKSTVKFTSVGPDDISWTSGILRDSRGKEFPVNAGSLHLGNFDNYNIYYQLNDPDLKNTQSFGNAVGDQRALIAIVMFAVPKALIVAQ